MKNQNKEVWEYIKEAGGTCKPCWFQQSGKCVKEHNFSDVNVPEAKELCKDYISAYAKMMGLNKLLTNKT